MPHPRPTRARLAPHIAPLAVALGATAACAPGPLVLDVPFEPDDRAALVVVDQGRSIDLYAIDAAARDTTPVLRRVSGVSDDAPLTVSALFYGEPLAALGLEPGHVEPPAAGKPTRGLPTTFRHAAETHVTARSGGAWATLDALKDPLTTLKLPAKSPCRVFGTPVRYELGGELFGAGIVPAGEGRAVIAAVPELDGGTRLYPITLEGVGAPRALKDLTAQTIGRDAEGRLWIAGYVSGTHTATVVVGSLEEGFAPLPGSRSPFLGTFEALVAPPADSGDPVIMYGAAENGRVEAYTRDGWTLLGTVRTGFERGRSRIAWRAPGDLLVSSPDGQAITRVHGLDVREEQIDLPLGPGADGDRVMAMAVVPGLATLAGMDSGYLLSRGDGDGRWSIHTQPLLINNAVWTIAPYAGGALSGESRGSIVQHYAPSAVETADGRCAAEDQIAHLGTEIAVRGLVPVPGGVLVLALERVDATTGRMFAAVLPE